MKTIKFLFILALCLCLTASVFAQTYFDAENCPSKVVITGSAANVRCGPSDNYATIATLYKNNVVDCKAKVGNCYLVHLENDKVGLVSCNLAKGYYNTGKTSNPIKTAPKTPAAPKKPSASKAPTTPSTGLTADEQEMVNLVNSERSKNGLAQLKVNPELTKVARTKAQDMVTNNYFSHTSPTYGSPFDMMKKFGITYKSAGENIAANRSVSAAHTALMNSPGHRANILSTNYTEIGIGIVSSPTYGLMISQMFIGK